MALPVAPGAPRLAPARRRTRALVVSGNARGQTVTLQQLDQLGWQVEGVRADEAVDRLLGGPAVDLLIVDFELEGTSGVELSEALEVHEGLNRLPRVMLTRTTQRPTPAQLKAAGVQRLLTRPVSLTELAETLAQLGPDGRFNQLEAPATARPALRSLSVLLVEDNAINARLARRLLERLGHEVTHVTNGALAVEAADHHPWDAVLMDMQMPELDGLDATRLIRSAEFGSGRHVPIIALTANAMKGDDGICFEAGMDAYLTKPINLEQLASTLDLLAVPATKRTA
jgi:CheY-like chemotaxis protein